MISTLKKSAVVLLAMLAAACGGDSGQPQQSAPGGSSATGGAATIAVLGAEDFVPDRNASKVGAAVGLPETLSTRIIEHLTNSKRFVPVERTALRRVILEQRFGQSLTETYLDATLDKAIAAMESVAADTVAVTGTLANYNDVVKDFQDLGSAVGAQYLVIGNLEKLARSTDIVEVPYTAGRTSQTNVVDARLQLRVIDVAKGTVLGATSIRTQLSEAVFEGKRTDSDQFTFFDHLGQLAATKVLDVTYPARVVSLQPDVISRGKIDGAQVGDVFAISREGKEITDGSGQIIARLKSSVGKVRAVDVQETVTVVETVEGGPLQIEDLALLDSATAVKQVAALAESPVALTRSGASGGALPRLAVGLVKSGSTARTGAGSEDHTPIFTDSIISRLTQTKRFQLIDRQEVDQLLDEQLAQALAENRDMPSAMGTLQGADYLVYGSIDSSSFTSETETIQLPNSSRTFQQTKWYVSGNMRIVDARSGDILESRKIAIEETPPNGTERKRIATLLADAYAEQVVLMLMNAIYPIKVATVGQDQTLYINRGSDGGLAVGEVLDAFRPGNAVVDPDTGVQLGVEELALGQVTLTEVEDARSKGRANDGATLQRGDILKRSVANQGRRTAQAGAAVSGSDTRSGAQLAGTPDKSQGKDNKYTIAVGMLKVNPSARASAVSAGHVKRMNDDLMVKLTNTNRFRVMERSEVDQILDEKAFEAAASGGDIVSRLRELIGADYLIHGEITNFYIDTVVQEVAFLDEKETNATARAEGMFRIVDVHSGAVVGADTVAYSGSANYVTDTTQLMSELMDAFTTEAVGAIVLRLFPIKVLGQTGQGAVYVNRGQDAGLNIGDRFNLMRPGEELVDPDTGLSFGSAETLIGTLEISSVEASRSVARLLNGGPATSGDILRPAPPAAPEPEPQVRTPNF